MNEPETVKTTTELSKKKQTLLTVEGDWVKTATYYRIVITKNLPWTKLSEFYDCGLPTKTLSIRGPNGESVTTTRPAIKEYLVNQINNNFDPQLLALFNPSNTITLYFQDRISADRFKNQIRNLVEYLLNDTNRKGAQKISQTYSIIED